jgi:hypothetical protein
MESGLIAAMIIQMCIGDTSTYYIQGYAQDCHHYYVNCLIGSNGEVTDKTLERCQNDKHKAKTSPNVSK